MNVAVIGASNNPERYSYQAVKLLLKNGHQVFPVHQRIKEIDGLTVFPQIQSVPSPIHTITLYVSADISSQMTESILAASPERIIFNPGAENPELSQKALAQGVVVLNACTLVMLRTGQF